MTPKDLEKLKKRSSDFSQYFPVGQFSHNNVDNFRDFADIKQDRLFRRRRKYRY